MKQVGWSKTAKRELADLNDWFATFSPDLPLVLTERVEAALPKLLDFPQIGSMVADSDVRKWRIRHTPYLIFYRPTRDGIRILKVRHVRSGWAHE